MKKIIAINLIFVLCLLFIFTSTSLASGTDIREYFISTNALNGEFKGNSELDITSMSATLYKILKTVGVMVALCLITYMAIAFMLAAPNKRAELKGRLIFLLVGVAFLVTGVAVLDWYANLSTKVADEFASKGGSGVSNSVSGAGRTGSLDSNPNLIPY